MTVHPPSSLEQNERNAQRTVLARRIFRGIFLVPERARVGLSAPQQENGL